MPSGSLLRLPAVWIALALGLLTHSAYLALDHDHYGVDTASYLVSASNLLHGQGFANALHQPELLRTPGYPLLLAIFMVAPMRVAFLVVFQHALCVFLIVAITVIALQITGSRLVAFIAASVLSLDVATVRIANLLLTEILFTTLIALTCWTLYGMMTQPKRQMLASAIAGLIGGCAALVRPVGILYFVPLAICVFVALRRRALRPAVVFVATFLLLPLLWTTRNVIEADFFGVSSIGAESILYYRAAGALAIQQPGNYFANVLKSRRALIQETCPDLQREYNIDCSQVTESQKASYSTRKGIDIIRRNLSSYFKSTLVALAYIIFGGGAEALSKITGLNSHIAESIVLCFTLPEACLAVAGCWYWYRHDRKLCCLLFLTVVYFLAISAGAEGYSRFRVPVMPMYALLVGGGAEGMFRWIRRIVGSGMVSKNNHAALS